MATTQLPIQGVFDKDSGDLLGFAAPGGTKELAALAGVQSIGRSGSIAAIGDSITAMGYAAPAGTAAEIFDAKSYLMQAIIQSKGALSFGGIFAQGGISSTTMVNVYLPQVLAAKPSFCVVHAPTNDVGVLPLADSLANLAKIYDTLIAYGITPVATPLLPKSTQINNNTSNIDKLSLAIERMASARNIPFVPWTYQFSDTATGNWIGWDGTKSPDTSDGVHLTATGARKCGAALWDVLKNVVTLSPVLLARANNNTGLAPFPPCNTNACFASSTTGIALGSTPPQRSLTAMTASEGLGNWLNLAYDGTTTNVFQQITGSSNITINPGDRIYMAFRIKATGIEASNGRFTLAFNAGSDNSIISGLRDWASDIADGVYTHEFTVPGTISGSAPGAAGTARLSFSFGTAGGNVGSVVSIGQILMVNLTSLGLA